MFLSKWWPRDTSLEWPRVADSQDTITSSSPASGD